MNTSGVCRKPYGRILCPKGVAEAAHWIAPTHSAIACTKINSVERGNKKTKATKSKSDERAEIDTGNSRGGVKTPFGDLSIV